MLWNGFHQGCPGESHICCCDKNILTESNLREKGFSLAHNSRLQYIIVEVMAAVTWNSHSTSTVKSGEKWVVSSQTPLDTYMSGTQPQEMVALTMGRLPHLNQLKHSGQFPTDLPTGQHVLDSPSLRLSSQVVLDCVKLIIQTKHHGVTCVFYEVPY